MLEVICGKKYSLECFAKDNLTMENFSTFKTQNNIYFANNKMIEICVFFTN